MENLSKAFQKQTKKHTWRDLSFITQFNIEFLLPLTVAEKCLEKCLKSFNLCLLIFLLIKSLKIGYTTESFLQNEVVNFLHLIVMANLSHTTLIKLLSWGWIPEMGGGIQKCLMPRELLIICRTFLPTIPHLAPHTGFVQIQKNSMHICLDRSSDWFRWEYTVVMAY